MGRVTESFRMRFQRELKDLKKFRDALSPVHKDAFDRLVQAWSSEQGAMTYANIPRAFDLMLLTGVVDNRKQILKLSEQMDILKTRLDKLHAKQEAITHRYINIR